MAESLGDFGIRVTADEDQIAAAHIEGAKKAASEIVDELKESANAIGKDIGRGVREERGPLDALDRIGGGAGRGGRSGGERDGSSSVLPGGRGGLLARGLSKVGITSMSAAGGLGALVLGLRKANESLNVQLATFGRIDPAFAALNAENKINQLERDLQSAQELRRSATTANRERERFRDAFRPIRTTSRWFANQATKTAFGVGADIIDVFTGDSGLSLWERLGRLFGPKLETYERRLEEIEAASSAGADASRRLLYFNEETRRPEEVDKFTGLILRDISALSGGIFDPRSVL